MLDPAFAPGTGTPEPGGCMARELAVGRVRRVRGRMSCDMEGRKGGGYLSVHLSKERKIPRGNHTG